MSKFVNKDTKMTAVLVSLLLTLNRVQHYFDVLIKQHRSTTVRNLTGVKLTEIGRLDSPALCEKCAYSEVILVRIFPHSK